MPKFIPGLGESVIYQKHRCKLEMVIFSQYLLKSDVKTEKSVVLTTDPIKNNQSIMDMINKGFTIVSAVSTDNSSEIVFRVNGIESDEHFTKTAEKMLISYNRYVSTQDELAYCKKTLAAFSVRRETLRRKLNANQDMIELNLVDDEITKLQRLIHTASQR